VNIDYDKNYTDVSYNVDLSVDENGARSIDCKVNGKQDAENICECDKRFAENIAAVKQGCDNGAADNDRFGPYCMDEKLRTITGITNGNAGTFDSRNTCEKAFPEHHKDQCCGLYPNRYAIIFSVKKSALIPYIKHILHPLLFNHVAIKQFHCNMN